MISLLVPTHNRSQTAVESVLAWCEQLTSYDAEIIVVNDGSNPDHAAYLQAHLCELPRVQLIQQEQAGLAAARNAAIDASQGAFLFFIDDDVSPSAPDTVEKALSRVTATNQPVVGRIEVPPAYRNTVIHELWHQRSQSTAEKFTDGQVLGKMGFRFAALMMPRAALHGERFTEEFHNCQWAEYDLGYRLHQRGVRVQFHADLLYHHLDMATLSGLLKKYETMGAHGVTFSALHPGARVAFLTGTAWLSRLTKTVLAYSSRGDRAVKKLAQYADEPFVGDPNALAVLSRDLSIALEGAYFRGTMAELQDRKRR